MGSTVSAAGVAPGWAVVDPQDKITQRNGFDFHTKCPCPCTHVVASPSSAPSDGQPNFND